MPLAAFAALAVLTLSSAQAPATPVAHAPANRARPADPAARPRLPVGDVYSPRAKRRIAAYLRMRLLELRELGLRRAVDVVEGRLPLEALLRGP